MKIIIRSKKWGSTIHGRVRRSTPGNTPALKPYRALAAQIDFGGSYRQQTCRSDWGCCNHINGGHRVLELTESHFLDAHKGQWNLYRTNRFVMPQGSPVHEFYLMPDNQTSINVKGWQFWGSVDACILRMDLEALFQLFFQEKQWLGRVVSHAHVTILMDKVEDKDPPILMSPNGLKELNLSYYSELSFKGKMALRKAVYDELCYKGLPSSIDSRWSSRQSWRQLQMSHHRWRSLLKDSADSASEDVSCLDLSSSMHTTGTAESSFGEESSLSSSFASLSFCQED